MPIDNKKNVKEEIAKALKEKMPEANQEEISGYGGLVLKKILSLPYFKGNYDYLKIYHQEDIDEKSYYSLAHPSINNFQNVTNETLSSVKFHFGIENDDYYKINEKSSRVLFEQEKESLSRSLNFLKNSGNIEEVKHHFENNKYDFYLFMSIYREYSFFGPKKGIMEILRKCVDLDDEELKNNFKVETYGSNGSSKDFKMDTFAVRDHFFHNLNDVLEKDKKRLYEIILDAKSLSGSEFTQIVFGKFRKYMETNDLMMGRLDDEDKDLVDKEKTKREYLINRVKKNKKIYNQSLLKVLEENPVNKHHTALYNTFLFEKQKETFLNDVKDFISKDSLESVFETHKEIIDPVYDKILEMFPEFSKNPDNVTDFKINKAIKTPDGEMYDLLEQLSDSQEFALYDIINEDLGGKNMRYFMVDRGMYNSPREETTLYATHNDLEVVSVNHFVPSSPIYGRNDDSEIGLQILTYNNIAEHFKNNEILKNTIKEEIFKYVEDKQIIVDVSRIKRDMPEELLEEARYRKNVFIATDGPPPDGMEIYYRGINEIRDALFSNRIKESQLAITKKDEPISYSKMLEIKKAFDDLYKNKLEKYEEDFSLMSSSEFYDKYKINAYGEMREMIENTAILAIQNVFSNDLKNKKTKKNKMS